LPFGSGVLVRLASKAHLPHVSALSRPGTRARYPASYPHAPGGGAGNNGAGFLLPFGRRPSLLETSCPARESSPSYDRPAAPPQAARTRAGFPCSARMSYGWIGCLLDPGGSGARATGCASPGRRLPLSNGQPLSPWITTRPRMSDSRGISEGSLSFTPASLPLACGPRRNGTLGLSLSFAPGRTRPCHARQGGDGLLGTARITSLA